MGRPLLIFLSVITALPLLAAAQTTDTNPARKPDVFLDNHRPLNQKKQKDPTTRNVSGKVTDSSGQPVEGALVTLTDGKTNEKRTFITKKDGRYNFEDLSFNIDYQLQARYKGQATDTRKLSQYDHNVNIVRMLQLDTDTPSGQSSEEAKKQPQPDK